jgi:hypothetical protein
LPKSGSTNIPGLETLEDLEKWIAALARRYAETQDEQVKAEIEALSLRLADLWNPH